MELHSEMSHGIFAPSEECFLNTYRAERELKILYFDGSSAARCRGVSDPQDALLYGEVKGGDRGRERGYLRAKACRWVKELRAGVYGFVRMNGGIVSFLLCS